MDKSEKFNSLEILKALAHKKHNDHTTTYYLLHKKWQDSQLNNLSNIDTEVEVKLVTLTTSNYEMINECLSDRKALDAMI